MSQLRCGLALSAAYSSPQTGLDAVPRGKYQRLAASHKIPAVLDRFLQCCIPKDYLQGAHRTLLARLSHAYPMLPSVLNVDVVENAKICGMLIDAYFSKG